MTFRDTEHATVWVRAVAVRRAAERAYLVLAEAGVPAIFVKGVITAPWLYAPHEPRPFDDVDLRIAPGDLEACEAALLAAGHLPMAKRSPTGNVVFDVLGVMIDIEPTIGPPFVCDLPVARLIERSQDGARWLGFAARVPELHDHALVLAVNVFKDHPRRASAHAVEDLARILALPEFDPQMFRARVVEANALTLTHVVLSHLARQDPRAAAALAALGPTPRPTYRAVHGWLAQRPEGIAARVWSRMVNDRARAWPRALGNAARVAWWTRTDPEGATLRVPKTPPPRPRQG